MKKNKIGIDYKLKLLMKDDEEHQHYVEGFDKLEFVLEKYDCVLKEFILMDQTETIKTLENKVVEDFLTTTSLKSVITSSLIHEEIKKIKEIVDELNLSKFIEIQPLKECEDFLFKLDKLIDDINIKKNIKDEQLVKNSFIMNINYKFEIDHTKKSEIFTLIERLMFVGNIIGLDRNSENIITNIKNELCLKLREEYVKNLCKNDMTNENVKSGFKKGKI